MDFQGQKMAERLCLIATLLAAVAGFCAGFVTSDFALMMKIYLGGVIFAFVLVTPDWPWFNRHPLDWLPPLCGDKGKADAKKKR